MFELKDKNHGLSTAQLLKKNSNHLTEKTPQNPGYGFVLQCSSVQYPI